MMKRCETGIRRRWGLGALGVATRAYVSVTSHPKTSGFCSVTLSSTSSSSRASNAAVPSSVATLPASELAVLKYPYEVVDTSDALESAVQSLRTATSIALDVEALCTSEKQKQLGAISLVQACSDAKPVVYVFDVLTLTVPTFVRTMAPLMSDTAVRKLFFDCRRDVEALSCQMQLTPRGVLDLQLYYTALQWKLRSVSRRSGMTYVLKNVAGIRRQEGDSAVQTAMAVGHRPVWDVRPLPSHFLEYAADDVRHTLLLSSALQRHAGGRVPIEAVDRLTSAYVEHYAVGRPVEHEADAHPAEVNTVWLERYIGPGGVCKFCGAKGHVEAECFKRLNGVVRCTFCGEAGHTSRNCYKKHPQLLKCELCGQLGHTAMSCFKANPCKHCGGLHSSANCHKRLREVKYF